MKSIHKYELQTTDSQMILMPHGAQIISCQMQREIPCLWAIVNPEEQLMPIRLRVYGTGHPVSDSETLKFIGTYQLDGGRLVFHIFEVTS